MNLFSLMNTMNESVAAVDTKFTELGSQLTDFFKQAGYSVPMEKVKIEPAEENDILVVDVCIHMTTVSLYF